MRESRFGREMRLEAKREAILDFLRARFGPEGMDEVANSLAQLDDLEQVNPLVSLAATCVDLPQFLTRLPRSVSRN
jgi:hypothetical protein